MSNDVKVLIKTGEENRTKIKYRPTQGIKTKTSTVYLWDPSFIGTVGETLAKADALIEKTTGLDKQVKEIQETVDSQVKIINDPEYKSVGENISTIKATGENISQVNIVASNIDDVKAVSSNIGSVGIVGENITEVKAVAGSIVKVQEVANNRTNIDTVAGNITDVGTVAENIEVIKEVPTQAANAASSAQEAQTAASMVKTNLPLLFHFWHDKIINDVCYLRADTFSWQSGKVYIAAYQHLTDDINGKTLQSETIEGITIQFYLADDGDKICPASEEQNLINLYNTTGIAWYYLIDEENIRFKLPRTKLGFEGITSSVGNNTTKILDGTGYPEINTTGRISIPKDNEYILTEDSWIWWGNTFYIGSRYLYVNGIEIGHSYGRSGKWEEFNSMLFPLKAGNVIRHTGDNSLCYIYPTESNVKYNTQMFLYFYVGNFTQKAIENTAGLNAELFNDKMDRNMNNMNPSSSVKHTIVSWGNIDWSSGVSVSDPFTASYDGLLLVRVANLKDLERNLYINGILIQQVHTYYNTLFYPFNLKQGDVFSSSGNAILDLTYYRYLY